MEWKTLKLGELLDYKNGLWAGKKGGFVRAKVIRMTEMKDNGTYNLSTAKELQVEERKLETRKVIPNSILLERSGGGENKPVGRVVIFGDDVLNDVYSFSNFTTLLIPKTDLVYPKYLFYFVYFFHLSGKTKNLQKAVTGIRNLEFAKYLEQDVPMPFKNGKPDLVEQKRIADDLDKIQLLQKCTDTDIEKSENLFSSIARDFFANKKAGYKKIKLGDECEVIKGKSPTLKTPEGAYPFVVTARKRRSANTFQFDGEAVCIPLVSSTGHGHASLHRIHYEKGKFALANILAGVVPKNKNKLTTKYLYYYLSFYRDELLVPLMRGVANVTTPIQKLNDVMIDVPEITEQKRFVSTLEEAEKLKHSFQNRQILVQQYLKSSLNIAFSET
ncbi:hypothetical protein A2839_02880 [Candidatus Uhrbacteria bacterium RIFCSPHIGHO2_01_FULL_47_10]|nr:MAG: hypothetical protein A2839_02880 [Candidatus Uhrbacteria bacterium RIFCSPHIGHO2_01_FULL_47_10]